MRIAHSKDFQRTFKGNYVFESIQGASILRMLEDWMGKDNFRDGCRVSETALPIYFIPFLLLYLFVGVFFEFYFSFSEIFERFPLQECQNSQLLEISHWCTLVSASFNCHLFVIYYSYTYTCTHTNRCVPVFAHVYIVCVHHACVYMYVCRVLCVRPVFCFCLQVSGLPVAGVMDTWTKQMGYPVLDLSISETSANLSQKRFLLDPNADAKEPKSPFGLVIQKPLAFSLCGGFHWVKCYLVPGTSGQSQSNGMLLKVKRIWPQYLQKKMVKCSGLSFHTNSISNNKRKKAHPFYNIINSHSTHLAVNSLINMWQKANRLWNKEQTFYSFIS